MPRALPSIILGLVAAATALTAIGVVRRSSLFRAPGLPGRVIYGALVIELGGAALCWWGARRARREGP